MNKEKMICQIFDIVGPADHGGKLNNKKKAKAGKMCKNIEKL